MAPEKRSFLKTWDLTLFKDSVTEHDIARELRKIASQWAFQKEACPTTGREHWQIRASLNKKSTKVGIISDLRETALEGARVSATATRNSKRFDYVLKKQTRVAGPWLDTDPDPEQIDEEIRNNQPRGWQEECIQYAEAKPKPRKIRVYVDRNGGSGKTWLKKYMRWKTKACVVPHFEKPEDMAQMVMCKPVANTYVVDIPRSITDRQKRGIWQGIESIKDGYCYDKRHKFRDRVFATPNIIVFTNQMPELTALSGDRWDIIDITQPVPEALPATRI